VEEKEGKMAFIRIKNIKGKDGTIRPYVYVVKSVWTKKGSRQKVIGYLGKSVYLKPIHHSKVLQLFGRYNHKCALCPNEEWLTIDHIKPLSRGGLNELDNLQVLCDPCNQKKRDLWEKPLENQPHIVTKASYDA